MIVFPGQQYTPFWWELRRCIPTASNFKSILTSVGKQCVLPAGHNAECTIDAPPQCTEKAGRKRCRLAEGHDGDHSGDDLPRCTEMLPQLSAGMDAYARKLYGEKANLSIPFFSERGTGRPLSRSTEHGIDTEAEARKWLSMTQLKGRQVEEVAFCCTDDGRFGFSPDGLIPDWQIGIELKCPDYDTHVAWVGDWLERKQMPSEHVQQCQGSLALSNARCWLFVSYCPDFAKYPGIVMPCYPSAYTRKMQDALEVFWCRYRTIIAMYEQCEEAAIEMPSVHANLERLRSEAAVEHEPIEVQWGQLKVDAEKGAA